METTHAKKTDPELTVVVTAHNRADVIDETLSSLATQRWDGDWDIILLDNDSTDATPQLLTEWSAKLPAPTTVVTAAERHNPSYARNTAVARTSATSVAFIDDDDVVSDGWVAAMGTALRENEFVASSHEFHRLNDPTIADARTSQRVELPRFNDIGVVSGGGMGCRRDLWDAVGGSNEGFRTGQDIDFSLRVARLGTVEPVLCTEATYSVRLRGGTSAAFEQGLRMGRASVHIHAVHGGVNAPGAARRWRRRWLALAIRTKKLGSHVQRLRWANDLGHELGRLRGMIHHRSWCP